MTQDTKVVIRDGQWLRSSAVFADYGSEEVVVVFDQAAIDHPLIADLPDNEHGQSIQSSREAMHRASLAASHARERGSIDDDGRITVTVDDLEQTAS